MRFLRYLISDGVHVALDLFWFVFWCVIFCHACMHTYIRCTILDYFNVTTLWNNDEIERWKYRSLIQNNKLLMFQLRIRLLKMFFIFQTYLTYLMVLTAKLLSLWFIRWCALQTNLFTWATTTIQVYCYSTRIRWVRQSNVATIIKFSKLVNYIWNIYYVPDYISKNIDR